MTVSSKTLSLFNVQLSFVIWDYGEFRRRYTQVYPCDPSGSERMRMPVAA